MILPVGDSPNPPGTAWVTYTVIAINVLVYLLTLPLGARAADPRDPEFVRYLQVVGEERGLGREQLRQLGLQVSEYDLLVFERGFRPAQPSPVDLLTSIFLHAGLMHLAGNMLFLWIYGDNVEHRLGRLGFALLYLATGVVASGGDALLRAGSNLPSVGASGAISGVLGLYFLWFPHNRVRLWFLLPPFVQIFELPARVVLGFYLVVENLWPLLWSRGDGGISYGAHIGGFVAGLTAAFLISRL
ncbi:MAG TPA: rhomboid family intramembrane serine protease, partial [Candidatus Polarisedimenticolaceae bacterium]|nr:rhomboid family intramembrane serine protease [Candidatus Polarisedimenticolaceae bacterium]